MRDKILKYAGAGAAGGGPPAWPPAARGWPNAARILDPVRASIVCEGASQMLQVGSGRQP
jgi:hypothetical protein